MPKRTTYHKGLHLPRRCWQQQSHILPENKNFTEQSTLRQFEEMKNLVDCQKMCADRLGKVLTMFQIYPSLHEYTYTSVPSLSIGELSGVEKVGNKRALKLERTTEQRISGDKRSICRGRSGAQFFRQ